MSGTGGTIPPPNSTATTVPNSGVVSSTSTIAGDDGDLDVDVPNMYMSDILMSNSNSNMSSTSTNTNTNTRKAIDVLSDQTDREDNQQNIGNIGNRVRLSSSGSFVLDSIAFAEIQSISKKSLQQEAEAEADTGDGGGDGEIDEYELRQGDDDDDDYVPSDSGEENEENENSEEEDEVEEEEYVPSISDIAIEDSIKFLGAPRAVVMTDHSFQQKKQCTISLVAGNFNLAAAAAGGRGGDTRDTRDNTIPPTGSTVFPHGIRAADYKNVQVSQIYLHLHL